MKRKLILGASIAGGVLALLLLASLESRPRPAYPAPGPTDFEIGIPTAQEVRSLVQGYGRRVEEGEEEMRALRDDLASVRKELAETARAHRTAIEALLRDAGAAPAVAPLPELPRFRKFEFGGAAPARRSMHVPAGSFGEATLLSGVYAPVNGEALPVLLRLDAALIGPARSRVPIRDAFLVGKAQGDANSERAVIQLQTISYVAESGQAVEVPVNGWVVDADGIQGLQGTYVWRAEEIAALAALTGGLAGGAEALAARETTVIASPAGSATAVTGDPLRFAAGRGASAALSRIAEIIERRMEEIIPAVHVANGKRVTVAFISGATLAGLAPEEGTDASNRRPFAGLDFDR